MNHDSTTLTKAKRLLAKSGYSFRLATMEEKRKICREYKKNKGYNPSWMAQVIAEARDVYDNFKKDVWVCFGRKDIQFFASARQIIRLAKRWKKFSHVDRPQRNLNWNGVRELIDEPQIQTYLHFCENCPEYCDWEEYRKNYKESTLTNALPLK